MEDLIHRTKRSQKLSKSKRLKKKKDFRFKSFKRFKTESFMFILGLEGKGRLGISISKKVLSSAVARNRIKRLIRETFRKNAKLFPKTDLNIIGRDNLSKEWKLLDYSDVQKQLISAARFVEENKKSE